MARVYRAGVLVRFCLYSVLKNLRFADPFLVLFLMDRPMSLTAIGAWLGAQRVWTTVLELPLGVVADRFGRRSALAAGFLCYAGAFAVFPLVREGGSILAVALALFGLGEALRTGSHKAIMLDWLDGRGESERAVEVVGLTRSFSRLSSGVAAMGGGVLLYATHRWELLFWPSAAAAAAGFGLMVSYPRALEGEQRRGAHRSFRQRLLAFRGSALAVRSVLFESPIKLVRSFALQPLLKQGLAASGLPIVGGGALAVGAVELASDLLGAAGARGSSRFRDLAGGRVPALRWAYRGAAVCLAVLAVCAWTGWLWPAVVAAVAAWVLQNARRPVFVAEFGQHMDKAQRATTLSAESLARTLTVAVLMPVCGLAADTVGLWAAFALAGGLLAVGMVVRR